MTPLRFTSSRFSSSSAGTAAGPKPASPYQGAAQCVTCFLEASGPEGARPTW